MDSREQHKGSWLEKKLGPLYLNDLEKFRGKSVNIMQPPAHSVGEKSLWSLIVILLFVHKSQPFSTNQRSFTPGCSTSLYQQMDWVKSDISVAFDFMDYFFCELQVAE